MAGVRCVNLSCPQSWVCFFLKPPSLLCLEWDCSQYSWKCSEIPVMCEHPIKNSSCTTCFLKWHRWIVLSMRCLLLKLRWQTVCCITSPSEYLSNVWIQVINCFLFSGTISFFENFINWHGMLLPFPRSPESWQLVARSFQFAITLWTQWSWFTWAEGLFSNLVFT